MTRLNLLRYEFKNAWLSMKRHWALCLSSVTTIFLCLSLIGLFVLIGIHVSTFSSSLARDLSIHVVLEENIDDNEKIEEARESLEALDNVASAQFSSRDAELELMIAEKGQAFAAYRGEENPLSNAFFVFLQDQERIDETTEAIAALPFVQSAQYGGSSVSELANMLHIIQNTAIVFIVLLGLLSLYLIYSTIKTSIDSRQTEIAIQKTVGATPAFIQRPFEIEGVLLGLLGAIIPFTLIAVGYPFLYNSLHGRLFISAFELASPERIVLWMALILLGMGAAMGFFASYIAVNRSLASTR